MGADAYCAYWYDYVAPRWQEHGISRLSAMVDECGGKAEALITLDCLESPSVLAEAILQGVASMELTSR